MRSLKDIRSDIGDREIDEKTAAGVGFHLKSPLTGESMVVIVSSSHGWDHVSVSLERRCPRWIEMEYVRKLFFKDYEIVMQLHLPEKDHINFHPFCLHMWRPWTKKIPLPPKEMV